MIGRVLRVTLTAMEWEYIAIMAALAGVGMGDYVVSTAMEAITGGNGVDAPWVL